MKSSISIRIPAWQYMGTYHAPDVVHAKMACAFSFWVVTRRTRTTLTFEILHNDDASGDLIKYDVFFFFSSPQRKNDMHICIRYPGIVTPAATLGGGRGETRRPPRRPSVHYPGIIIERDSCAYSCVVEFRI